MHLDTTMVDFNNLRWEKGDLSFLCNSNSIFTVLDNQMKLFQMVRRSDEEENHSDAEGELDLLCQLTS